MPASPKNVATSDITAVTGLRRVMVKMAKKTTIADSAQKAICSPMEGPAPAPTTLGCLPVLELGLEVGPPLGQEPEHRPRRRVAQRADGVAADPVGDVGQQVDVARLAVPIGQPPADARQPAA